MPNLTINVPPKPAVVTILVPGAQGPQGLKGDPNTLTIGTVTSGTAAATITGTAPNQVLNLTLPTGPQGTPGDLMAADAGTWTGSVDLSSLTTVATHQNTLSGNTTITVLPPGFGSSLSGSITIVAKQAASGGPFTLSWPSALEWNNNASAPTMPTAVNSELVVSLFWTGTAWRAAVVGVYFP